MMRMPLHQHGVTTKNGSDFEIRGITICCGNSYAHKLSDEDNSLQSPLATAKRVCVCAELDSSLYVHIHYTYIQSLADLIHEFMFISRLLRKNTPCLQLRSLHYSSCIHGDERLHHCLTLCVCHAPCVQVTKVGTI